MQQSLSSSVWSEEAVPPQNVGVEETPYEQHAVGSTKSDERGRGSNHQHQTEDSSGGNCVYLGDVHEFQWYELVEHHHLRSSHGCWFVLDRKASRSGDIHFWHHRGEVCYPDPLICTARFQREEDVSLVKYHPSTKDPIVAPPNADSNPCGTRQRH